MNEKIELDEIELEGYWYKNCKNNRRNDAKCCQECPFREFIEAKEAKDK